MSKRLTLKAVLTFFLMLTVQGVFSQSQPAWNAPYNVMQEKSYCGRANPNEPLVRVLFYFDGENWPEIDVTPWFNNFNGPEITKLKAWVRLYPEQGNPLRGYVDAAKGENGAENDQSNIVDLGVFDYRQPRLAPHQDVLYIGEIARQAENGQKYTIQIRDYLRNELQTNHDVKAGSRFYIYVTADISAEAVEYKLDDQGTNFQINKIGATVNEVRIGNQAYTPEVAQENQTRQILLERQLMYAPFDGYSRYYAIPAMTTLTDGTIVAAVDARKYHNHAVRNDFDVISRRSDDYGRTWSDNIILAQGHGLDGVYGNCQDDQTVAGYGGTALGALKMPGAAIALFVGDDAERDNKSLPSLYYAISTNSGKTWSAPRTISNTLITGSTGNQGQMKLWTGPGSLCLVKGGKLDGKLVVPIYSQDKGDAHRAINILCYDYLDGDKWNNIGFIDSNNGTNLIPEESQLFQIPGTDSFILSVKVAGTQKTRRWFKLNLLADGTFGNYSNKLPDNQNGFEITDSKVYPDVNSNIFITEIEGTPYLVQSIPTTDNVTTMGDNPITPSNYRTADVHILMADLTAIKNATSNMPALEWKQSMNMTLNQQIACYSSCIPMKNNNIGIMVEEYPIAYQPTKDTDCQFTGTIDPLFSIWYMETSIKTVSQGQIPNNPELRQLEMPKIEPLTTTFAITEQGAYQGSTSTLPEVKITVDDTKIKVLDDEKWNLTYAVSLFHPEDMTISKLLIENTECEPSVNSVTFTIPFNGETFHPGDQVRVDAWVRVHKTDDDASVEPIVFSEIRTETYTAVYPYRKAKIEVMPAGSGIKAEIMTMAAIAQAGQEMYVQPGEQLKMRVSVPELTASEFVGFSLNPNAYEKDALTSTGSLFQPIIFADKTEVEVIVPTITDYPGTGDDNLITIYAWVESYGGLYSASSARWNSWEPINTDPAKWEATWCSDPTLTSVPDPKYDWITYPKQLTNKATGELSFFKGNYTESFIDVELRPDRFSADESLVAGLWKLDVDGNYTPLKDADEKYIYRIVQGRNEANLQTDFFAEHGKNMTVWYDDMMLPCTTRITFDTEQQYIGVEKGENNIIGKMALFVVNSVPDYNGVAAIIEAQTVVLNQSSLLDNTPWHYMTEYNIVDNDKLLSVESLTNAQLQITTGEGCVTFTTPQPIDLKVVSAQGIVVADFQLTDCATINLPAGIYIANGKKLLVR